MNKLVRFDPFAEINALQDRFFSNDWLTPARSVGVPMTDVYTKNGDMVVEAHLPNFSEDDVNVEIDDGCLVIRAEKHEKSDDKDKRYVVRESSTSFYRRIQLPERADTAKVDADMENGMLTVKVPITPLPEPKKITVKKTKR